MPGGPPLTRTWTDAMGFKRMSARWAHAALLALAVASLAVADTATIQMAYDLLTRGGTRVAQGSNTWQVAMLRKDQPRAAGAFCSATLINDQWALTAAHCFHNGEGDCKQNLTRNGFYLLLGSVTLNEQTPAYQVEEVVIRPGYDCKAKYYDIALVKLAKPVPGLHAIELPDAAQEKSVVAAKPQFHVAGWGARSDLGLGSRDLIQASVPVMEYAACKHLRPNLPGGTLCAGDQGGGDAKRACRGDSGGPLYVLGKDKQAMQLGIVSFGEGCEDTPLPGVYTQVSVHKTWIQDTAKLDCRVLDSRGYERC